MVKRFWIIAIALATTVPLLGCGGIEEFPTAPVTGTVTCEGVPVPGAQVYFEPLMAGESAITGKPAFAIADGSGNFTLGTYASADGAVVGQHRVRVDPPAAPPEGWSCNCEMDSNVDVMEVEVVDGENNFDVILTPKKSKAPGEMTEEELEEMMDEEG